MAASRNWSEREKNIFDKYTELMTDFMIKVAEEANEDEEKRQKLIKGTNRGGEAGSAVLEKIRSDILEYTKQIKSMNITKGGKRKSLRKKRKSCRRKTVLRKRQKV